ncbi:carbonic anhydrase XVb [Brachionichthys hirsutus]|uniref:carbonic anhydrase XVb n=1 Tax=Brachionichthys hirsutus TaxID=412623 RepID=UPI00360431C1
MKLLVAALYFLALCANANGSSNTPYCYHDPSCNDTTWPVLFSDFCNGSRQSPVDIDTSAVTGSSNLTEIIIANLSTTGLLSKIENTGRTIKVQLNPGIEFSGGNLSETYEALQFHLHWGNGSSVPGSEHTLDGRRFPAEMHIVTIKKSLNRNTTLGVMDPEGFAAFGYFIEESTDNNSALSQAWASINLTGLLFCDASVSAPSGISLGNLTSGVNHSSYYRYKGSLTTPNCYEAVVWTVFKDTIAISSNLIDSFSSLFIGTNTSSPMMVNVFRSIQPDQPVSTQEMTGTSAASTTFSSLGLIALSLLVYWS